MTESEFQNARSAAPDAASLSLERALVESELLSAIATATAGQDDLAHILAISLEYLHRAIAFTGGSINLVEGDELVVRAAVGPFAQTALGQRVRRSKGLSWRIVESCEPFLSHDLLADGFKPSTPLRSYLAVPLVWRGLVFGLLEVDSTEPHAFTPADLALLQKVAAALSGPIELAQRYAAEVRAVAEAEAAQQRLAFLAEASIVLGSALDYERALASMAELAVPEIADSCVVDVVAPDGSLEQVAISHSDPARRARVLEYRRRFFPTPKRPYGVYKVVLTSQPQLVSHVSDDILQAIAQGDEEHMRFLRELAVTSYMIVPLIALGRTLGAVSFYFADSGRHYKDDDLTLGQALAGRASLAIENSLLYQAEQQARQRAEQTADRMARLQELTAALSAALTPRQVAKVVMEQGLATLGARSGVIVSQPENEHGVELLGSIGYTPEALAAWLRALPQTPFPLSEAMRTRKPIWLESADERRERFPTLDDSELFSDEGAWAALPLLVEERLLGGMRISFSRARQLSADDRAFILALSQQCAQALERARLYRAARQLNEELEERVRQRTLQLQTEIGERKRVGEQLRQLASHVQTAREEERTRVAREIHDELGQALTVVKMELSLLTRKISRRNRAVLDEIKALMALLDSTIRSVRQIIRELRPDMLDDVGLRAAMEWLLQEFQTRTGIECHFSANVEEINLDSERSLAVFRVLQESLTNVARHADASRVDVTVRQEDAQYVLEVRDNGRGISENDMATSKSFGILGMRERTLMLRGELRIEGAPGQGTTVTLRVPA